MCCCARGGGGGERRVLEFPTSAGCPLSSGQKPALSAGSIILILLLAVCVPLYVIGGCVYNRFASGASGVEAFPHIAFWRALPGLVRDGFVFTWRKLTCSSAGGGYTNVP